MTIVKVIVCPQCYSAIASRLGNMKDDYLIVDIGSKTTVKLCLVLGGAGTPCSIKRVRRHMAEQGLRSVVVKKYSRHASHGSIPDDKVNILKRDFGTETINQKWCTDITCIHVQKEGWTYLASVMDLCSRKITGYAYGTSMTAEPAVKAVENGCMESFHSVLKKEEIYLHTTSFVQSIDIDPNIGRTQYEEGRFEACRRPYHQYDREHGKRKVYQHGNPDKNL